jgi:hypothetical protein
MSASQFTPKRLNLPDYPFKIKQSGRDTFIYDEIRKKFLVLTPEEWVRQHFVQYLIHQKKYPKTCIRVEGGLKLNSLQKRTDIVVFNLSGEMILMVECKAPHVKISQDTFDQIARYNLVHKTPLLAVSNGMQHFFSEIDFEERNYKFISELPSFKRT